MVFRPNGKIGTTLPMEATINIMELNRKEIFKSEDNRFYIKRLVIDHYPKRQHDKDYIRRVYGVIKDCGMCKTKFFTQNTKTTNCSDRCAKFGKNNPNYKGGRYVCGGGYIMLNINGKKIKEHRYIMEQFLKRALKPYELIHHRNAIKTDNRLENLEIIIQYPKSGFHKGIITCPYCTKDFSIL